MTDSAASRLGRLAYGALFALALPVLLVLWARRLDALLSLPAITAPAPGLAIAAAGAALMAAGALALWVHGRGLPMSPFPPPRLVTRGAYRLVADPLYIGAVLVALGVSLAAGSAGGLWIVSPTLALAAAAWVIGYERDATRRRHGAVATPLLRLPPSTDERPTAWERASVFALVLLPWLVLYMGIERLGVPPDARLAYLPWEAGIPVIPWTEALYATTYPLVLLAPLVAARRRDIRAFALGGLWAMALILPLYLLLPLIAPAKPVPGDGLWQALMRWERHYDSPVTAFPAFHVVWTCLAARLYAARWPRLTWLWRTLVLAIAASCVTTGMHAVMDVVGGFLAYALVVRRQELWRWICDGAEAVANSWREQSVGPIRLINHGLFAAVGAVIGLIVAVSLLGTGTLGWLGAMTLAAIVGAGLWAQLVEGSPQLLRPFGYFGSVFGVLVVTFLAGAEGWKILAGFGVGAAFAQGIGRGRCLIQGCCHGRGAPASLGIRYTHPSTRPVRLAGLAGVPLHPTQLYSMLWMTFVGFALLRLWALAAPVQLIVGSYFILTGLGRFVEEGFRGEPQTAVFGGLRLYQWLAIAFVIGGAAATTVGATPTPAAAGFDPGVLPILLALGAVSYFAFGADVPASRRRFSRLA